MIVEITRLILRAPQLMTMKISLEPLCAASVGGGQAVRRAPRRCPLRHQHFLAPRLTIMKKVAKPILIAGTARSEIATSVPV